VARRYIGQRKYSESDLGTADDLQDADDVTVLTFSQAQQKAREWWKAAERAELGLLRLAALSPSKMRSTPISLIENKEARRGWPRIAQPPVSASFLLSARWKLPS
jgi:hypothetical protein